MESYRFFVIDGSDRVAGADEIQCENDACARHIAETRVTDQFGVEVWDVDRRVCKLPARRRNEGG